jgi:uncharacterized membrane protein affecting hemolysin expression
MLRFLMIALFSLTGAVLGFVLGLGVNLAVGIIAALLVAGLAAWWSNHSLRPGLSQAEGLARSLARRQRGRVSAADLVAAGLEPKQALASLEALCARGDCAREGDAYRFSGR